MTVLSVGRKHESFIVIRLSWLLMRLFTLIFLCARIGFFVTDLINEIEMIGRGNSNFQLK